MTSITDNPSKSLTLRSIAFWRHIVGIAIIHFVQYFPSLGNGMFFLGLWAGAMTVTFCAAGFITGFGLIFFTNKIKTRVLRVFVITAWILLALRLWGEWYLPTIIANTHNTTTEAKTGPWNSVATPNDSEQFNKRKTHSRELASYENKARSTTGFISFEVEDALNDGYTKKEIAEYFGKSLNVDIANIYDSGYSDDDVIATFLKKH